MSGRRFLGVVFVVLMQSLPGFSAALAGSAAAKACAAHDLLAFGLIEKHGEDQSLPPQLVADAAMKLLSARVTCRDGRDAEAIALYTDLGTSLAAAAGRR
ncbi:hypothetical protein [Bosea psychrotolerans]|uniref:Rap1a immunity protein domain-containing protein n=1 Tax=Bosea psychrotolerans TaxID=1871628 RepID=A0A2S4MEK3_9HYPH|nr:hypothetical protein [Bosea psychrotolerans]POR53091.1 hypothetical protein CYD53_10466 [Bosea psychrotolerans]